MISFKSLPWLNPQHHHCFNLFAVRSYVCPSACHSPKKKVVFLGSPKVAANILDQLFIASQTESSLFEIAAIVTQPPAAKGRGQKLLPSPVAELALEKNFPESKIFWPQKAGEESFLQKLADLGPDLCITAAYGNILPKRFLKIPKQGTVNIHPSLLPLYRGAAPVQRAIQDGVDETGVTVAFTVRAMDAGPIITSKAFDVDNHIKAPELLEFLFDEGVRLLLRELPSILDGSAAQNAQEQDHTKATHAPKVTADEAWLDFGKPAVVLHNKVRAFAEWPGTKAKFELLNESQEVTQDLVLKIITTKPHNDLVIENSRENHGPVVRQQKSSLFVSCGCESTLEIVELQPPGKRVMKAKDFVNGLQGKELRVAC
ncbi:hypothetical protein KP509_32G022600 [Ceratopteris richardii]|uniref:Methionyl-tRNA formyltransferase, mitochondrial n=1 Tax=Ceratopteris richardii TaxID=49495 RepID=A0A8T2QT45_CERRI|nr:hypothetical protein KP509_32G022600 [Ceratopteris richardii]